MSVAISKNDISMIKCLATPPPLVVVELSCTALLLGIPEQQAKNWKGLQKMLAEVSWILKQLHEIDATKIPRETAVKARDMLVDVTSEKVKQVSQACQSFHQWNQDIIRAVLGSTDDSGSK